MEKEGMNRTTVALIGAIVIIAALLGAVVWLAVGPQAPPGEIEYKIGVAIAVSGGYAVDGPFRRDAAFLAIEHMNDLLEGADSPIRFTPVHEDTKGTAADALAAFESLAAAGIEVVVGPLSSGEVGGIRDYANTNKIVSISPSSTSVALAVPNDYIFRMPPTDIPQSEALAQLVNALGYTKVAVMARNDDYGKGIADLFGATFVDDYAGTVEKVLYTVPQADYAAEVDQLTNIVEGFGTGADRAVLLVAFDDDGLNIFEHARTKAALQGVRWFGSESVKRTSFFPPTATEAIGNFLLSVELTGFFATPAESPLTLSFEQAYSARWGRDPSPYSYYAYDAAWVAMQSILTVGKYDGEAVASVLPKVCENYIGASGHKKLDANGDGTSADYVVWQVEGPPAVTEWDFKEIGIWSFQTKELTFYP